MAEEDNFVDVKGLFSNNLLPFNPITRSLPQNLEEEEDDGWLEDGGEEKEDVWVEDRWE